MKKIIFLLFCYALLLCLPIFLHLQTTFPRLDTDYDSSLPIYSYMVTFIRFYHAIPFVIPLVNNGMSVFGDPLNSFFNPLLGVPFVLFGINIGLRVAILLSCFFSGIAMFFLLKKKKIMETLSLFGAFLYMSGGAFFAAVAAGHIEKFLIYPFVPLLLLFSLPKNISLKSTLSLAIVFSASIYSGDMYATWFFVLIFTTIRGYYFFLTEDKKNQIYYFLTPLFFFIIFSLLKLYPFFTTVLPRMQRIVEINPYKGSLEWYFFPISFVMPFGVWFWDRPFFQRNFGFYYNWYEYFAFLSPFPFLFLKTIKKTLPKETVKVLLLVLLMGVFYFSLAYAYSPFYYLFRLTPLASFFRVPQRIVLPMTAVIVVLLTLFAAQWKGKGKKIVFLIFVASLIWTLFVDWHILQQTFVKKSFAQQKLIHVFAKKNKEIQSVVDFAPQTQLFLVEENISIDNYYYGWIPADKVTYNKNGKWDYIQLIDKKPQYVVTDLFTDLTPYGYTNSMKNESLAIWQHK